MLAFDNATQQRVAVKRIPLAAGFKRNTITRELLNHSMCSGHPHIIQLQVSLAAHLRWPVMLGIAACQDDRTVLHSMYMCSLTRQQLIAF